MADTRITDCYYYFSSSCSKGDNCRYRHCSAARETERVCPFWTEGHCHRTACPYRHTDLAQTETHQIPCYWEKTPTGCLKPHCTFMHVNSTQWGNNGSARELGFSPPQSHDQKFRSSFPPEDAHGFGIRPHGPFPASRPPAPFVGDSGVLFPHHQHPERPQNVQNFQIPDMSRPPPGFNPEFPWPPPGSIASEFLKPYSGAPQPTAPWQLQPPVQPPPPPMEMIMLNPPWSTDIGAEQPPALSVEAQERMLRERALQSLQRSQMKRGGSPYSSPRKQFVTDSGTSSSPNGPGANEVSSSLSQDLNPPSDVKSRLSFGERDVRSQRLLIFPPDDDGDDGMLKTHPKGRISPLNEVSDLSDSSPPARSASLPQKPTPAPQPQHLDVRSRLSFGEKQDVRPQRFQILPPDEESVGRTLKTRTKDIVSPVKFPNVSDGSDPSPAAASLQEMRKRRFQAADEGNSNSVVKINSKPRIVPLESSVGDTAESSQPPKLARVKPISRISVGGKLASPEQTKRLRLLRNQQAAIGRPRPTGNNSTSQRVEEKEASSSKPTSRSAAETANPDLESVKPKVKRVLRKIVWEPPARSTEDAENKKKMCSETQESTPQTTETEPQPRKPAVKRRLVSLPRLETGQGKDTVSIVIRNDPQDTDAKKPLRIQSTVTRPARNVVVANQSLEITSLVKVSELPAKSEEMTQMNINRRVKLKRNVAVAASEETETVKVKTLDEIRNEKKEEEEELEMLPVEESTLPEAQDDASVHSPKDNETEETSESPATISPPQAAPTSLQIMKRVLKRPTAQRALTTSKVARVQVRKISPPLKSPKEVVTNPLVPESIMEPPPEPRIEIKKTAEAYASIINEEDTTHEPLAETATPSEVNTKISDDTPQESIADTERQQEPAVVEVTLAIPNPQQHTEAEKTLKRIPTAGSSNADDDLLLGLLMNEDYSEPGTENISEEELLLQLEQAINS